MHGNRDKSELVNVINWATKHLNKEEPPRKLGRQELYVYNDGTLINVKTSIRATDKK